MFSKKKINNNRKFKIAYFGLKYFPSKGGTSRVIENLILRLKSKYNITLFCYKDKRAKNNINDINVIEIPMIPLGSFGVFLYYLFCTIHILFSKKYDLIHVHKIDASFFIPFLRLKAKVIGTSHESPYTRDKWSWLAKFYFHINEKIFIKYSNFTTSISKHLSNYYQKKYGKEVAYIPNGVNIIINFDNIKANKILRKYDVKEEYLLFAARRIMATKGCHTFLKAIKKINYTGTILIAGDTNQLPKYTEKLKAISRNLNVKFIGYISPFETLLALVKKSKLFVFPSENEGMSIMLLEVVSAKTPIIASDIPENTVIFDNKDLLYFKNKDSDDLASKISWALDHSYEMQNNAEIAYGKILDKYSWSSIALKYSLLYEKILKIKQN